MTLRTKTKIKDLLLNFCVMCVYSQKSTTDSKAIPRIGLDGFYPWDGLAIRGNNSSVAAKGCCRRVATETRQNGICGYATNAWTGWKPILRRVLRDCLQRCELGWEAYCPHICQSSSHSAKPGRHGLASNHVAHGEFLFVWSTHPQTLKALLQEAETLSARPTVYSPPKTSISWIREWWLSFTGGLNSNNR